jgi:hypothetical protein
MLATALLLSSLVTYQLAGNAVNIVQRQLVY